MSAPDTHVVLIRPAATSRWEILEYAESAKSALTKTRKQRTGLAHGDLILGIDIAEVSAIQERGKCLYFVNKAGVVTKAPPLHAATWFLEWEGPNANASYMLGMCDKVGRKLLVMAACAMARTVLRYIPAGEHAPRNAIEMAEAWVRNEATLPQIDEAIRYAYGIVNHAAYEVSYAARAAIAAASAINSKDPADRAYFAAIHTANAIPGDYFDSLIQLANIVREHIPLYAVLESRV